MPLIDNPGRHEVTIKSATFGETSDKGTPFLQLDGETDDGHQASAWIYLTEKALEGAMKTLRDAFGFDGNFETAEAQATGKRCVFVTAFETYNGKERIKVKFVNGLRAPVKAIGGGVAFLKSLTKKAANIPIAAGTQKPTPAKSAPAGDPDFPA